MEDNKIVIYQTEDGQTQIDVRLENETVWLNVAQMSTLFSKEESNVRRHIINAFKEGELERDYNNVHFLHVDGVKKPVPFYSLDVIISVGYRVKSKRGTAFRIWARNVLKEYLVKGYAVNERMRREQIGELRQLVGMLGRTIQNQPVLSTDETNALFEVVTDYTYALDTLDNYDYERLTIHKTTKEEPFHATYENAMEAIDGLRKKFGGSALFGNEKDESFKSSIGQIYQTFGGEELYPSVEEKAAMLLYLVTKNHSFSDGNKRIAATLFQKNGNKNVLLPEHQDKIMELFAKRKDEQYLAKLVKNDDILGNDCNLSVSSYVEQEDTREVINISEVNAKLETLVAEGIELNEKIDEIIKQI